METFSPRMPLSLEIAETGFSRRKTTPGDIGDSLFQSYLSRINEQGDEPGILSFLVGMESPGQTPAAVSGEKGQAANINRLIDKRVMLTAEGLPRLARFLENQGFTDLEIKKLFESLADKNGDIRMDRLLAGLQNLLKKRAFTGENLLLDRSDIPRVKEALFKMGLGADQVRNVMERALNADGRISLSSLTSALGAHLSNVEPETGRRLALVLQREMGIGFRAGDIEQAAKDAGLDQALSRLAENSSDSAREAVKREIAMLMLEKGVPAQEVKQFLESLSIRRAEVHGPQNACWAQKDAAPKNGTRALQDDPDIRIQIQKRGSNRQKGPWKERIIEILNREEFLAGRKRGTVTVPGQVSKSGGSTEMLEEALLGRLKSRQPGVDPGKINVPGGGSAKEAASSVVETAKEAAKAVSKGFKARQGEESGPSRTMPTGEIAGSRLDRAEPHLQAASAVRNHVTAAPLPEPLPKIVDRMFWMVHQGEQASRIQISPPELGRLDLSIVIKEGHLHAHVSAENPMVKEIIEANLHQLKQQLGNLGFTVERFDVSAGLDERRFSEFQARTRAAQRNRQGRDRKPGGNNVAGVNPDLQVRNALGELYRINVRV